jgi:membrane fusion protein, multidrug efflux system
MRGWLTRLLLIPPIVVGALVLVLMIAGREPPERRAPEERALPVRVVEAPSVAVTPRAVGYGEVAPARRWEAVAEVPGRVTLEHPELARGALLEAGTLLLRLDPAEHELRIARAEAAIETIDARRAELERREANLRASLAIDRRALELAEAELQRRRDLLARGAVARAAVDQEERQTVQHRQAVQNLENQLALLPAERRLLEADRRQREAELASARLDLERTEIRLPFDARIGEVMVREGQFAGVGKVMATADGIDAAEITAQLPMARLRRLIPEGLETVALTPDTIAELLDTFGLEAIVRLRIDDLVVEWPARVDRVSDVVDPRTRTLGVIIVVDRPYEQVIPGRRPPLVRSMFVEVELRGRPRPPAVVVPRDAVEGGRVLLAEAGRLRAQAVVVAFTQGEIAVIADGLLGGELVVVSDVAPAIEGQLLEITPDEALLQELLRAADGRDDWT